MTHFLCCVKPIPFSDARALHRKFKTNIPMKLRGLVQNFYIHASVSNLYMPIAHYSYFAVLRLRTDRRNIEIAHRYMK
jgi:hypothetical protein